MFVQDVIIRILPLFSYIFFPKLFSNIHIFHPFPLCSQKPWMTFLKDPISFKTPGGFLFYLSTGSRISSCILYPACKNFSKKKFPTFS